MEDQTRIPKERGGLKDPIGIYFRCDAELRERLKRAVEMWGVPATEIIRNGILEELKRLKC